MSEVRADQFRESTRTECGADSGFARAVRCAIGLVFAAFLTLAVSGTAEAQSADDLSFCGGNGQRGCCATETIGGGCDTGVSEFLGCDPAQVGSCSCPGIDASTTCLIPPHPQNVNACGGPGQRACCSVTGEATGPCDNGTVEVTGCSGAGCLCGGSNPADLNATSMCQLSTGCGGPNQRACCIGEGSFRCDAGLAEVDGCGPAGTCTCSNGLVATTTCYPVTPCGGSGQRACCTLENIDACQPGLVEVGGCSGDCTCEVGGVSAGTCTPAGGMSIAEPGIDGIVDQDGPSCKMRGYMDMHLHLGGHLAHGGGVLGGTYYDPVNGVNGALGQDFGTDLDLVANDGSELPSVSCPADAPNCGSKPFHQNHGTFEDSLGSEAATRDGAAGPAFVGGGYLGAPSFGGWPKYTTTNHQQAYYKWLERAWRSGLRLTTMLAVSNTTLCETSNRLRNTDCSNIMSTIDLQIQDAWAFQAWLDQQSGGAGEGWFRIVLTPEEARQVIGDGKLAVVLGIEVDHLFNCKFPTAACTTTDGFIDSCDPAQMESVCSPAYVDQQIDLYYGMGVRHVFPIHNYDNSFGGTATWQNAIEAGNRDVEGHWWTTRDCGTSEYSFALNGINQFLLTLLKFDIPGSEIVNYPFERLALNHVSDCNDYGLFPLGEHLVNSLMDRGMIIDIDHMSSLAFSDTLDIAEARDYPAIVASHVQFTTLNTGGTGGNRHERMRTDQDLERIRQVGGMIATMAKDDVVDSDRRGQQFSVPYGDVDDTCLHSSRVFAQMYQYSVDRMQGPVAIGSDFNGIAGHVAPRFGSSACGTDGAIPPLQRSSEARFSQPLNYPFTIPDFGTFFQQQTGLKTYDFNVDGLAHIGLFPDMIADMMAVGLTEADLDPLFRGAEAYVDMWDRAAGTYQPAPEAACANVTVDADASCQAEGILISTIGNDARITQTQLPGTTFGLGTTSVSLEVTDDCNTGSTTDCFADVTVVDSTAPAITCPAPVTVECTGATTFVAPAAPTASDNCTASPTASCPQGLYAVGSTTITCAASDAAGNQSQCSVPISITDTGGPTALCQPSVDVFLDPTGNAVIAENLIDAGSSDLCSAVTVDTDQTSFNCGDVGTSNRTLTVTDGEGFQRSCTTAVTVFDVTNPVATCQNATVTLTQAGTATISTGDINLASADACLQQLSLTQSTFTCNDAGSNFVQLFATDVSGNTAGCSANVEVLKRPTQISLVAGQGQFSDVVPLQATLTDVATGNPLGNSGLRFTVGANEAFATTDANGVATIPASLTSVEAFQGGTVTVRVDESCLYLGTSASTTLNLLPEDATGSYDPTNPTNVAVDPIDGLSEPFSITVFAEELVPDAPGGGPAQPGNIGSAFVAMQLLPVVPGPAHYGACLGVNQGELTGASYGEAMEVRCDFDDVPPSDYTALTTIFGLYDGEVTSSVFAVPEPGFAVLVWVGVGALVARSRATRRRA